jgi:suppressor for copper-sensitivity B
MNKSFSFFHLFFSFILFPLFGLTTLAEDGAKVHLSLISDSKTVGNEATLLLGLRAQMAPGWKTYWRSPGVAGYGLNLNWEGSKNIKSAQILWPLPHRSPTQMGQVNGYDRDVIFPIRVTVADLTQPVHVSVFVDMLVCDQANCLPVMQPLTLDLPVGAPGEPKDGSPQATLLQQAMGKVPQHEILGTRTLGTLHIQSVEVEASANLPPTLHVVLTKMQGVFSKDDLPDLFLEMKDKFFDTPRASLSKDQKTVQFSAPAYADAHRMPTFLPDLAGKLVTLTIGYQHKAFEIEHVLKATSLGISSWGMMLLTAFIGGLILNIMPCVLPVLSLKILSVMRHGKGHNATVRQEFLATVSGIIFSFLLLASSAILLKISGHAVGWGVQFQEPCFLIGLIGILTLFTCNLFGFFEFRLPSFLSSLGGTPRRESLLGSFLEGSLVTALATPCTAPFLGTALAFALSRGIPEILSIFTAMGIGLAFPFLLVAFFPQFATKLPKPGAWMLKVKSTLGFLVIMTIIWLIYILIAEIGQTGASLVAMVMLVISLFLKKTRHGSEARKKMAWLGASFLIATSFTLPAFVGSSPPIVSPSQKKIWHPFEPDRIASYVKAGKTVFVSITADWCLTCQANKYFVLKSTDVLETLHNEDIVAMEADWTNHDPKITAYLQAFNQYGIPFYAVYGCQTPQGRFLGQLLTPQKVVDVLKGEQCPVSLKK